jgi:beta-lactamase regulating signal transducer with metallopeptidase domain
MTTLWITYGLLVGLLIAAAAAALETVCRIAGRPVRGVWAGALLLTVVLVGLAPFRSTSTPAGSPSPAATLLAPSSDGLAAVRQSVNGALIDISKRVSPFLRYLPALWIAVSAALLVLFVVVHLRVRRRRRAWPRAELCNVPVRVAPDGGPLVVGLSRSEIVIPRWLLSRTFEEQRLVLAHECEHVRARDPLLLGVAWLTVALLPWHPAAWWMLSRLRLAIELDCDVRVLRQGVAARTYGTLLIDLAGRCAGLPVGMPALADRTSHLQQRLLAMTPLRLRFAHARGLTLSTFGLVAILAACAADVPVAPAQNPVRISASRAPITWTPGVKLRLHMRGTSTLVLRGSATLLDSAHQPLVIRDGVRITVAPRDRLDPKSIGSIEVLSGRSAVDRFGQDAAHGALVITTKKARPGATSPPAAGETPTRAPDPR